MKRASLFLLIGLIFLEVSCKSQINSKNKTSDLSFPYPKDSLKDFTIKTDTSEIEVKYFAYLNSIREFNELKNSDKTYFRDFYFNSHTLKTQGVQLKDGTRTGIWKYYLNNEKISATLDYDNGIWTVADRNAFPFYDYLQSIKFKGDNIIIENYGYEFFNKYVIWNIQGSAIYNNEESGDWIDKFNNMPDKFLLKYNIRLNKNENYNELISFSLDSNGKLIFPFGVFDEVQGFEHVDSSINLIIKRAEAILLAKGLGLAESDSIKASGFLAWQYDEDKKVEKYNGRFIYSVLIKTTIEKDISPKGRSRITDRYDAYNFNPWSKKFLGIKKMKSIYEYEERSGFNTGLIPDK
jgi:hypothetical protein